MSHSIRFESDSLFFAASHFITFGNPEKVEALHGHNFRVQAEISGPLNQREYVVDFILAFESLKRICEKLSHKVLIARDHPCITLRTDENLLHVAIPPLAWSIPTADALVLPIKNMTTEALAEYVARIFRNTLEREGALEHPASQYTFTVALEESPGMWAVFKEVD